MNKDQRELLREALNSISIVRDELQETVCNLEENFPNHARLEELEDQYERLDTLHDELETLIEE